MTSSQGGCSAAPPRTSIKAVPSPDAAFSEETFYLQEFRDRTLGFLISSREQAEHAVLRQVLDELRENRSRVVLVGPEDFEPAFRELDCEVQHVAEERLEGRVWRGLRRHGRVALLVDGDLVPALLDVARRLALYKVIRLGPAAGYRDAQGKRRSFVDSNELAQILALPQEPGEPHGPLLREIAELLAVGVPNVNLCTVDGLHAELFTYSGSGTLFTRERHVVMRELGVDDFDAADDLIARGVAEGYLAARSPETIDGLLADGFGAFVEGRHLAGIGSLRVSEHECAAEVASLYALTRFLREGIGGHLVRYALERARDLGLEYVYACTTSDHAREFFRRQGFVEVRQDEIPQDKWLGYDAERRRRVSCYRLTLGAASTQQRDTTSF